ncbi:MAG: 4'-phosphopantetheinyl transferase superfamily protein [Verrucomicrobia bacterium]|nr:4'-phosphopantetheinyl transferase superfamily protein [Verrucomicrobiota bacterium]
MHRRFSRPPLPPIEWAPAAQNRTLGDDEVHLWCASLDQPATEREFLAETLSPDERERAARFHFEEDQHRFAVGRGVLRMILGAYLNQPANALAFSYGRRGKPSLSSAPGLQFNLAHSAGLALYAITSHREVGVDVEVIRPLSDLKRIAQRFFSSNETAQLLALPEAEHEEAFFNCWTRKEAYLKATGEGITAPLDQFEVSLIPGEPAALLANHANPREVTEWSMFHLRPAPGCVGALAIKSRRVRVQCWQWRPGKAA